MEHSGQTLRHSLVVVSWEEEWSLFHSILQQTSADKDQVLLFHPERPNEVCNLKMDDKWMSFHGPGFKADMTEEDMKKALNNNFLSISEGVIMFLLLIQGGRYTKRERKIMDTLMATFGLEALQFLSILSLEEKVVMSVLDDELLEIINTCDGRFYRTNHAGAPNGLLGSLVEIMSLTMGEDKSCGYTRSMHKEAQRRYTEDASMQILRQKLQEANEQKDAFEKEVQQNEQVREKGMEALKAKHAEERRKEAKRRKQYETQEESLEEAVRSHRAVLQLQSKTLAESMREISIILLGLSGSGKTSARDMILQRAGNQYSMNEAPAGPPEPTLSCQRVEVVVDGVQIGLVDTPELWDEDGAEQLEVVKDCLALALPGPHVFVLVLQVGRFTQGESEMVTQFQKVFGRDFSDHTMVLFTRCKDGHKLRKALNINAYVCGAHPSLQELVRRCGSRFHLLDLQHQGGGICFPQVKEFLAGVNRLVASHAGAPYLGRRFSTEELKMWRKKMEERLF